MSQKTNRFVAPNHINPNEFFYSMEEVDDQDDPATEDEVRLPGLPDLIEVEDLRDEDDSDADELYVQQFVSDYEAQQFND
ncbi:MAG: hypothetical protein HY081_12450 [Gammaproteobacteria bacterium]|nr:hypothetical protein [Gammaproteobacteria bacterium]